ncbi:MAG: M23 family metallopeptidase [Clostridia bacterium]|nr:M23 family metallopeptidase [Clostridia bacterium]
MKKTDSENKFSDAATKVWEFMKKNSAYGVFAAVVLTVVTVALISLSGKPDDVIEVIPTATPTQNVQLNPTIAPKPTVTPPQKTILPTTPPAITLPPLDDTTPQPTTAPGTNGGNGDSGDQNVNQDVSKTFSIVLPFSKKTVITGYSNETPIYSETLHEWACHVGLDFSCKENDAVTAAANGIVTKITEDSVYGISVLVSHSDDFFTLYRGLGEVNVTLDELISQGQSIGSAAGSIPFEAHMPTHIHFELIKDGLSVDPLSFVK